MAFQRGNVYELLSHCFWRPSEELFEFIKAGEFLRCIEEAVAVMPFEGDVIIHLAQRAARDLRRLGNAAVEAHYDRLDSPKLKLLHECMYHNPFSAYEEMADIGAFYRAFGLDWHGERPDHISYELDFMRIAALKEANALRDKMEEPAKITAEAQRKFLESHLGRWAYLLGEVTKDIGFYHPVSSLLDHWIQRDCDYLEASPDLLQYPVGMLKEVEPGLFGL